MIDVWLIFNLLLPFIEVLVHTYMDTLRLIFSCRRKTGTTTTERSTITVDLLRLVRWSRDLPALIRFFQNQNFHLIFDALSYIGY